MIANALTAQQIFFLAAAHLIAQGRRSYAYLDSTEACAYRSPDGLKCGVGALIDDRAYRPACEGQPAGANLREAGAGPSARALALALEESGIDHVAHRSLLRDIQSVHDADHPSQWRHSLRRVAERHGLTPL